MGSPAPRATGGSRSSIAVAAWFALVGGGALLLRLEIDAGHHLGLAAPPLHARVDPVLGAGILLAAGVAGAVAFAGPRLAATRPWRTVLVWATGVAGAWAVSLAAIRGIDRLADPLRAKAEYLAVLPRVDDLGTFLSTFTERIASYPVHVEGHPPGVVVVLWALRSVGAGGAWWAGALFLGVGVSAVAAVLIATRDVAGEMLARRAAPFVVLAPVAIWMATSADALFTGLATWGATLVIVATGRYDRRGDVAAVAGGLLLGAAVMCSYGLALVGLVPLVVARRRRRARPIGLAATGVAIVVLAFLAAGFWWLDGLFATRARYFAGIAARRPYSLFLMVDLAAFSLALGPAVFAGVARLRDSSLWLLVGAALAAVLLADLSGMSKGEVERIWLPFTPWLLLAPAALTFPARARVPGPTTPGATTPTVPRSVTTWLLAQAALAIVIETLVLTPW